MKYLRWIMGLTIIILLLLITSFTNNDKIDNNLVIVIDSNMYHTIKIGSQIWMLENLRTTRYNDGRQIPDITDNDEWKKLTSGANWYYDNIQTTKEYGHIYNWFTIQDNKLCPIGWHIPTDSAWAKLINYLGGDSVAGGKLKLLQEWKKPNVGADNNSKFSAIPGGGINQSDWDVEGRLMTFQDLFEKAYFWTSTFDSLKGAWVWIIVNKDKSIKHEIKEYNCGFSVRCIKNLKEN